MAVIFGSFEVWRHHLWFNCSTSTLNSSSHTHCHSKFFTQHSSILGSFNLRYSVVFLRSRYSINRPLPCPLVTRSSRMENCLFSGRHREDGGDRPGRACRGRRNRRCSPIHGIVVGAVTNRRPVRLGSHQVRHCFCAVFAYLKVLKDNAFEGFMLVSLAWV